MLLDRMGFDVRFDDVVKALDHGPLGEMTSLSEIKQFLETLGLSANGWKGSYRNLEKLKDPVIVHMDDAHFAVLVHAFDQGVVLLDPKIGRLFLEKKQFNARWKGVLFRINT
jgi:ABC-type bacteriocin/lantibiotic exporter with double-glycine peptidase domain